MKRATRSSRAAAAALKASARLPATSSGFLSAVRLLARLVPFGTFERSATSTWTGRYDLEGWWTSINSRGWRDTSRSSPRRLWSSRCRCVRRFIGDISESERILIGIGLRPDSGAHCRDRHSRAARGVAIGCAGGRGGSAAATPGGSRGHPPCHSHRRSGRAGHLDAGRRTDLYARGRRDRLSGHGRGDVRGCHDLAEDGTILYCNRHLADMLEIPLDSLLGASLRPYVADSIWNCSLAAGSGHGGLQPG